MQDEKNNPEPVPVSGNAAGTASTPAEPKVTEQEAYPADSLAREINPRNRFPIRGRQGAAKKHKGR